MNGLASPDPATFLASANEYFAADSDFTNNHSSPPAADLFTFGGSGLLTIGTLGIAAVAVLAEADDDDYDVEVDAGSDSADNDDDAVDEEDKVDSAVTPTSTYPTQQLPEAAVVEKAVAVVEAIAEKDDHTTTEDDLMVVSAELEKVLGGRNSGTAGDLVASARVSFAMGVDCPLQGFLFGSPVSDAESRLEQRRDSNDGRRTSLGELFMRTRFADDKVALVAVEEGEDGGDGGAAIGERDDGKAGKGGGCHKTVKKRRVKDEKVPGNEGGATKRKFQKVSSISPVTCSMKKVIDKFLILIQPLLVWFINSQS